MGYIGTQPVPKATHYLEYGVFDTPTQVINVGSGYTVNNISVVINGVTLNPDEYTATDGVTVDLGVEFDAGTSYRIEEYRTFVNAYHYTKEEADARFAKLSGANNFTQMPTVGGTPIVESGSNSDGEWTRWADGTQECRIVKDSSAFADATNKRFSVKADVTYPMPFNSVPTGRTGSVTGLTAFSYEFLCLSYIPEGFAGSTTMYASMTNGADLPSAGSVRFSGLFAGKWK